MNENRTDSDIDIIVVSKDFRNKNIFKRIKFVNGLHRDLVRKIDKPVDLLYCSDTEWEKGSSMIINVAKKEGLVFSRKQDTPHYVL